MLGVIALLLSWVPVVSYLAIVLGLVGLGLGIAGILTSHRLVSPVYEQRREESHDDRPPRRPHPVLTGDRAWPRAERPRSSGAHSK